MLCCRSGVVHLVFYAGVPSVNIDMTIYVDEANNIYEHISEFLCRHHFAVCFVASFPFSATVVLTIST